MRYVLTADAMREADRLTIETFGIPGFTLMETAGRAVVQALENRFETLRGKRVTCVVGTGNNGGDGLVIARVSHARGADVDVVVVGDASRFTEDSRRNFRLLEQLVAADVSRLRICPSLDDIGDGSADAIVVDAVLGTGVQSAVREPALGAIKWMNDRTGFRVAVDVPSGLDTDTGQPLGAAVRADATVTMAAIKPALVMAAGRPYAGDVSVAEIGIPEHLLSGSTEQPGCARILESIDVRRALPVRDAEAHKYSAGLVLVVGGSPGLTGAPVMAANAAARAGAGAVVCAAPASVRNILAKKLTDVMTVSLPENDDGVAPGAEETLTDRLRKTRALLIGCGLGRQKGTGEFVRRILSNTGLPVVLDADGLYACVGHTDLFQRHSQGRWILTPHKGEFQMLVGHDVDWSKRVEFAAEYARKWNCVLLLKGMPSVVGCPDGTTYLDPHADPAVATAGTGDVLAGTIAGLLAQGSDGVHAALLGLYIGGAAAERYARDRDASSMVATDLVDLLPETIHDLRGGS